jgi:RNA polymerase sigma-70 factor (ECF subfamily)
MEDTRDAIFEENRTLLFSIAYRMLGTVADAEDVVQDTYVRWRSDSRDDVESPKHYLISATTRQAINHLNSARVRREEYVGSWLPEPMLTAATTDPVELSESLMVAFLVLLESLSPVERAVFLLSEVFDYRPGEVAEIMGKSEANCRQILHRAREAVNQRRRRYEVSGDAVQPVLETFGRAVEQGDIGALLSTLDANAVAYTDSGGKVRAAINPVRGADRVARFVAGIAAKGGAGVTYEFTEINRQPGMLAFRDGELFSTVTFDIADGRIHAIYITSNPDKLQTVREEQQS